MTRINKQLMVVLPLILSAFLLLSHCADKGEKLFDGRSFSGWEGDTITTWRIEDGSIVGGSLEDSVPHNDFLCTRDSYGDFALTLKFKLTGKEGFVNAGIQFRSQRLQQPAHEMTGYQADLGPGYWGGLYDESRRNKTLQAPDSSTLAHALIPDGWNEYEIRAEGTRIRLLINGHQTVDYTEHDEHIPRSGLIGLQIHGGGKAEVRYRDLMIKRL
jgi:hypothetical protein